MTDHSLERLSAFSTVPDGGNPAGVWIGATLPNPREMLRIAQDVGDSETAFLAPTAEPDHWTIRYFSPEIEIDFCGHATIASDSASWLLFGRDGSGPPRFGDPVDDDRPVVAVGERAAATPSTSNVSKSGASTTAARSRMLPPVPPPGLRAHTSSTRAASNPTLRSSSTRAAS